MDTNKYRHPPSVTDIGIQISSHAVQCSVISVCGMKKNMPWH